VARNISVVPATDYEPLIGEGFQGSGFIFFVAPGVYLAATSRHQFEDSDKAPKQLIDLDDLEVTLDTEQVLRQRESQIQVITAVSKKTGSLEFQATDVVAEGDELWLITGTGERIVGKVTTRGQHALSSAPRMIRMSVKTSEIVAGSSGAPVVHAATGRVVGVMQAADKAEAPTSLKFETLNLQSQPVTQQ
jgi:hypothetical protein